MSFFESLSYMAQNWTPSSTILTVVLPYVFALLWALYYFLFKRSKKFSREELAPFLTFYDQLTKGATAGFDKEFLRLFHPGFFHTKEREMRDTGLLRAIARGVQDCYGPVKHIDEHVVVHKQSGLSFNCAVLVDFQKVRRVQCQLSWVVRLPSVMKSAQKGSKELHELMISGIRRAPVGSFHVTGFKIVPPKQHEIDFLKYIEIDDFISLGELFVEKLLTKQDTLVDFFVPSLADKYKDAAQRDDLWGGVTRTLAACGGLKESDMDPIFVDSKIVKTSQEERENSENKVSEILGFELTFFLAGKTRNMEVQLDFRFVGMSCCVSSFQLTLQADHRTQVVVDHDTKQTTLLN